MGQVGCGDVMFRFPPIGLFLESLSAALYIDIIVPPSSGLARLSSSFAVPVVTDDSLLLAG